MKMFFSLMVLMSCLIAASVKANPDSPEKFATAPLVQGIFKDLEKSKYPGDLTGEQLDGLQAYYQQFREAVGGRMVSPGSAREAFLAIAKSYYGNDSSAGQAVKKNFEKALLEATNPDRVPGQRKFRTTP